MNKEPEKETKLEKLKRMNLVGCVKEPKRPSKEEMLDMLDEMTKRIESLPPVAMYAPVTHADFCSLLMLISAILRAD